MFVGNGFDVFVGSQIELQLMLSCASAPFLQRFNSQYPGTQFPIISPRRDERKDSVISRVGSSLSTQIRRLPCGHSNSSRELEISRPQLQPIEIPEWEFKSLETPRSTPSPAHEHDYDRYVQGMYGPPAPPKDIHTLLDQYRRDRHGDIV
jgi:hypothetical protein